MPHTQARKKGSILLKEAHNMIGKSLLPDEKEALRRILIRTIRRERRSGPPIFFEKNVPLDSEHMRAVLRRIKKRRDLTLKTDKEKQHPVSSTVRIRKRITAGELASRITAKQLLPKKVQLTIAQQEILLKLITHREKHFFQGTRIPVGTDKRVLLLKLVNQLGPTKTQECVKEVVESAKEITQIANKSKSGGRMGDAFVNIHQRVDAQFNHHLSEIMTNTEHAVREGFSAMKQEMDYLKEISTASLPEEEKTRIKKVIEKRLKEIRDEIHIATSPRHYQMP